MKPQHLMKALLMSALIFGTAAKAEDITPDEIRKGYLEHAALAQFHRWFQFYERPEGGVENALDNLSPDIIVTSGLGTANGHDDYAKRVLELPDEWKNAHHIDNVQINFGKDESLQLSADVTYQNTGLLEDGGVRQAELSYAVDLIPNENVLLPLLSTVTITQESEGLVDTWVDAYPENRTRSLVHYYLAIIEDPSRDAEPMRELFTDDFVLNFSSGAITDFDGFKAWLAGPGSQISASTHTITAYNVVETAEGDYKIEMDFEWVGILPDETEMQAKTRHNWIVTNDVSERFARISKVDVEVLEPFRPK